MDLISHGLWGGLVLGRRRSFLGAALFGLLPDVLAFAPYLVLRAVRGGLPDVFVHPRSYPQWVLLLYNSSHSLVAAGLIFIVLRRWRPRLAIPFWPGPCTSSWTYPPTRPTISRQNSSSP